MAGLETVETTKEKDFAIMLPERIIHEFHEFMEYFLE